MTIHSPAQRARIAVTRARFGKGRRKKFAAVPITRVPARGLFGPMVKVLDQDTRSLIDDAVRKRVIALEDS